MAAALPTTEPVNGTVGYRMIAPAAPIPEDWQLWSTLTPTLIRPLTKGLTNRSFLLLCGSRELVLRVNSPIGAELDLDRRAEEQALRLATEAGLSAPLVYCDPEYRYLVTEYLGERRWHLSNRASIAQLATLLRDIHTLPTIDARLDINAKVSSYWQSMAPATAFTDTLGAAEQQVQQHIDSALALASGDVLTHNDLLTDNLIVAPGGRLLAIDWEYAGMGDPFHDLAVVTEGLSFTPTQQQSLLLEYLQRAPSKRDVQRLHHWQVIYRYLCVLWYGVQAANNTSFCESTAATTQLGRLKQIISQRPI
ncbi:choline/ethanolamine kinase family protein [Microbulbifer sp.]|uniref:choline/ethanolamine kinase family protein n=1 Tax=Microbulbifer sp. TaxID=1908541 RepID=UPI00258A368F|nr:choline/ethanolamine kinase family protein [Microbulbifer sp.]